jgi:ribosomal protein S1
VKVLAIDPEAKRISLSIRALLEPEVAPVEEEEVVPTIDDGEEAVAVDIEAMGAALEAEAQAAETEE